MQKVLFHAESLFEWQYLHAIDRDLAVNVVFHKTDIFGECQIPYVSIGYNVRSDCGHMRGPIEPLPVGSAPCGIVRTDFGYLIDVRVGPLRLRGTIKLASGLPPARRTELLRKGDQINHWEVLVADASFRGQLQVGATMHPLDGAFYMDRQWGDLLIQQVVSDWIWGHVVGNGVSLVFFHILSHTGGTVTRAMQRWAGVWHLEANVIHSHLPQIRSVIDLGRLHESYAIKISENGSTTEIKLTIQPNGLLRLRHNEIHSGFVATYARWHVHGTACRGGETIPVVGVTEYLRIRGG